MDRLTERRGDLVYFRKDGNLLAPLYMSGSEVRQALQRLAEFEDAEEERWRQNMKQINVTMETYHYLKEMGCIKPWTK